MTPQRAYSSNESGYFPTSEKSCHRTPAAYECRGRRKLADILLCKKNLGWAAERQKGQGCQKVKVSVRINLPVTKKKAACSPLWTQLFGQQLESGGTI